MALSGCSPTLSSVPLSMDTFRPTPATTRQAPPLRGAVSTRMPPSFLFSHTRSLGHFSAGARPLTALMTRRVTTPAASESAGSSPGVSANDQLTDSPMPLPSGHVPGSAPPAAAGVLEFGQCHGEVPRGRGRRSKKMSVRGVQLREDLETDCVPQDIGADAGTDPICAKQLQRPRQANALPGVEFHLESHSG